MTTTNDQAIEAEIQAKGLTAPRVSLADLQANIVHTEIVKHVSYSGQVLRWAVLTTRSGFAVTGRPSASVSAENDNAEIGEKVAKDNAIQELWPLMGYALSQRLAQKRVEDAAKAEGLPADVVSLLGKMAVQTDLRGESVPASFLASAPDLRPTSGGAAE